MFYINLTEPVLGKIVIASALVAILWMTLRFGGSLRFRRKDDEVDLHVRSED